MVAQLLDPTEENLRNISSYISLEPTYPGMYNLPVCRLYDLGVVPNSVHGPWPTDDQNPGWPAQSLPCSCMSNDANFTNSNGMTTYFRDFAGDGITTQLNSSIEHAANYAGGTEFTCYVTGKNQYDCTDFLFECETVGAGPLKD